jgi:putative flippase GtrA
MGSRWRRVFTEAYRFLAVGGIATIVAFVIFNFLLHGLNTGHHALLDGQPYLAYLIANLVGMAVSYRGSRTWVFKDRPPRSADGGRTAFILINLVTMLIPIGLLWFSRNVLNLDDPYSDNVAANVIGLFLGLVARFYLFRTFVFQRPVHLPDLMANPLQVFELSELQDVASLGDLDGVVDPEDPDQPDAVNERSTGRSRSGPAPRPGP